MTATATQMPFRCLACGSRISRSRTHCVSCAITRTRERFSRQREERVSLIEEYLELGIDPVRIAADFAVTPGAVARQMYRCGRPDLAKRFHAKWPR